MGTITIDNAKTKSDIAILLYAHKLDDFYEFTALAEYMLEKYHKEEMRVGLIKFSQQYLYL